MSVILYRYDASPFSVKIDNVLLLKNIPHEKVNVASMMPRPEISDLLGITYRRIPILAIGNDIYCDTSLIASALERRFPKLRGYGTIFPNKKHGAGADTGLIKAFSKYWPDTALFPLAPVHLPWDKLPPQFVDDRSKLRGAPINVEAMVAQRGKSLSMLSTNLALIEEQLADGREWLFDTELPSLADISVHNVYGWVKTLRGVESLFDANTFPKSLEWLARLTAYLGRLKQAFPKVPKITGKDAAARITAASFEPYNVVGFDEREGARLGLKAGDEVSITSACSARDRPWTAVDPQLERDHVIP
ncbi:Glutathione s-transferase [Mycena sanguinolenta]|uniref:Glutathione s-transferase n=1 Tax=Mycena sanguinolenta TaxID=230812 RepID=A0A8H6YHS0_9AGAR|nr:Glutathione s-transferase [Mycena sanguinolenta]